MSPRARILATLNRTPTDRSPVDIWCTAEVLDSLRAHVREDDELAVYQKLRLDKIVWIFPGYVGGKSSDPNKRGGTNPWPLGLVGCETPEELTANAVWPNPEHFDYAAARKAAQRAREFDFATIGPWISHFEIYCGVRGLENGLMDVVAEPELLRAGLEQIDRVQTGMLQRMLDELGDLLDIVFISDDLGTQESLLISTGAWEEHLQPRLKRWCDIIHEHGKKVLFHTDGAARPFIPGLIASGIDILNPIQHICPGMDRAALKKDFGKSVIFHGGVDNQRALPFGTPEDVRLETRECLDTLGGDGEGYICCSCHMIQADTPVANILAFIEEAHKG